MSDSSGEGSCIRNSCEGASIQGQQELYHLLFLILSYVLENPPKHFLIQSLPGEFRKLTLSFPLVQQNRPIGSR